MTFAFWLSLAVIAYVHAGYPLLLAVWARLGSRPVRRGMSEPDLPSVSLILVARNEGARLASRVDNLLSLDYPRDRLQIIVASDGSTDSTATILDRYHDRIEIVHLPPVGKAIALNEAVRRARHDVLAFADARQVFATDALRRLVETFADERVGAVSGELILDSESVAFNTAAGTALEASPIAEGVGLYWRYEKWLRRRESLVGSTLGTTGAISAMRRSLWRPLPPRTILDDVLAPMRVVLAGRRVVFEPRARAFDRTAPDAASEARRKNRTLAGNYQLILLEPRLLLPWVNPVWLQFVSHKLGRLLVPYALAVAFVSSAVLAPRGLVYLAALAAQLCLYALAAYGAVLDRRERRALPRAAAPAVRPMRIPEQAPERAGKRVINA
jgi:poly-beta-1,6-N-acetyl-D-glucosamine synthase